MPSWKSYEALNGLAFAINIFVVQTSMLGWYGETNSEMSKRYQTFVTPAGFAFSIWGIIFLWELAFTIFQLLPSSHWHTHQLVENITVWWVAAQAFQVLWTFAFAQNLIWLSAVFMLGIYLSLAVVVYRLFVMPAEMVAPRQWWICHVPFMIHFAWITCATLINVNVVLVAENFSLKFLLAAATCTLGGALMSSVLSLVYRSDMVHSFVVAWALFALYRQLLLPTNPLPFDSASKDYTLGLAYASLFFCILSLFGAVSCLCWVLYTRVYVDKRGLRGTLLGDDGCASIHVVT